ncbi:MAG: ASCH domain-containing protein [Ruminococcaceae bacterium]|nr:ASCH domain-containing protein [Oscillospiraceae bacterium]
MKANEMFRAFLQENNLPQTDYDAFAFGVDADLLAELVRCGKKTACSSLHEVYAHENAPLPKAGQYSVVLDSRENAVCVIRTTLVYMCAFNKVSPLHAAKEGEGNGSLAYWRREHEDFFRKELSAIDLPFTRQTPVVCEEFELVYPKQKEDKA